MKKKRTCYQCGGENLEEVQAKRAAEIRAWADEQIAIADRDLQEAIDNSLTGVPQFEATLEELAVQQIPEEQKVPTEEEAQETLNEEEEPNPDAMALTAETEEEKKIPAKRVASRGNKTVK